jgi:hypothetical protein
LHGAVVGGGLPQLRRTPKATPADPLARLNTRIVADDPGNDPASEPEVARAVDPGLTTLHLHDSNGRALDNARAALSLGVRSFDASAGGLGGCPYAPGARGNVDTASLVAAVEAEGYTTGVDREAVARAMSSIRQHLRPAAS